MNPNAPVALVPIYLAAVLAGLAGWVMNVCAFVGMIDQPVTGMWIARLAGIPLFLLGAILGWC